MPEIMEQRIAMNEEYMKLNQELDEVAMGMAKILRVRQHYYRSDNNTVL